MKVATSQEMRSIDRRAIEQLGIPSIVLMETAGRGVAEAVAARRAVRGARCVVVCGRGNNGGDGMVAARHLHARGARVEVLLLGRKEEVKGDPLTNLQILQGLGVPCREVMGEESVSALAAACSGADIVVDALLGTGTTGDVTGPVRAAIEGINAARRWVVAVDGPSGIDLDVGWVLGAAVWAECTVTFGLAKRGHFLYPGRAHAGDLVVVDIGYPPAVVDEEGVSCEVPEPEGVRALLPRRPPDAHKGTCGRVLVVAGSVGYTGAAALASEAALRAGAGLVTLGAPASLNDLLEEKLTEVITLPLPETPERSLDLAALEPIERAAQGVEVVALGPGLSRQPRTQDLVRALVPRVPLPLVLDADGINALAGHAALLRERGAPTVITPHPGELGRLLGLPAAEVDRQRATLAPKAAADWGVIVVLKGAPTVIASPEGRLVLNPTGNAGMATGGTGDVLTGLIAGLCAQGASPFEAAVAGVYVHGLAGDRARRRLGERGMIAGDLLRAVSGALRSLDQ